MERDIGVSVGAGDVGGGEIDGVGVGGLVGPWLGLLVEIGALDRFGCGIGLLVGPTDDACVGGPVGV